MKVQKKSLGLVFLSFLVLLSVMVGMLFTFKKDVAKVKAESLEESKSDIKISVIIPVYKTEKYLDACLKSVTGQTLKDIEIICINDGSPDNCGKILESWKKKDSRVKVVHQKNKGVSAARNAGIDLAVGEYLKFVDSDDMINKNTLKICYEDAKKYQADVVIHDGNKNKIFNGPVFKRLSLSPCYGIYKRSLIEKEQIRFKEGLVTAEDQAFNMMIFPLAKKLVLKKDRFYYYRNNPTSTCHTVKNMVHAKSNSEATKHVYNFWKKRGYFKKNEAKVEFLKWWSYINYDWWRTKSVDKMFVEAVSSDPKLFKEDVLSLLDSETRNKVKSVLKNSK